MRKHTADPSAAEAGQPALVVVYGCTRRKHRPLLGDLVVVGRSPGCDIGLVSPEVAPVHCVLVRFGGGWRVRDCSGRATRVNGKAVRDEPLRDGDILQVGAFSFQAHLPAGGDPAPTPAAEPGAAGRAEHIKRSRRRLAQRALLLRARVRGQAAAEAELLRRQADLERLEHRLRAAHQDAQARAARALPPAPQAAGDANDGPLKDRAAELDHFARHLRRLEQRLREREAEADRGAGSDIPRQRAQLEQERQALADVRQALELRQAELEATVAQVDEVVRRERRELLREREQVVREQAHIDQQRRDLLQQRLALERLQVEGPAGAEGAAISTKETWHDAACPDKLESARQLLRELAQRRKAADRAAPTRAPRLPREESTPE
jgi:hypothetical protein